MTEPFATYRADIGDVRTFDGRIVHGPGAPDSLSMLRDDLNDAALKYAADKIREAAVLLESNWIPDESISVAHANDLRSYADRVERGES